MEEVTLIVDQEEIKCDKKILQEESDYFRAMFASSMIESQSNIVTLHEQVTS